MLGEKGLAYKPEQESPFLPPPNFHEISPLKRFPVLRDAELPEPNTIPDSSAICDYLEHKFPKPALYPSEPFLRARALFYEDHADTVLGPNIGPSLFFERIVKKMMRGQTDEAIVAATIRGELPPLLDYLDKEIDTKNFFVGNAFSIADIAMATMFVNFKHAGEGLDSIRWPNLARYVTEIHNRPSFKVLIDEERPISDRFRAA